MNSASCNEERIAARLNVPADRLQPLGAVPALLLAWYDGHARVLPWRSEPTAYRVWVSEIMLQQTRVEAVLPYFERFLAALPTVQALAGVEEARLLKLWEGLGYYSRARNLKRAAQVVVERFGGELPGAPERLLELPGIGPYTAGAIASIAYGVPAPAVDGNVLRVFARLAASGADVGEPALRRAMEALVLRLIPVDRPGDFNQALMDLGATICLPHGTPRCQDCPLASLCHGRALGVAQELPVKAAKTPRRVEALTVYLIVNHNRLLLRQRDPKGLLAGLMEFPNAPGWQSEEEAAAQLAHWNLVPLNGPKALGPAKHVFTHVEWHMRGYQFTVGDAPAPEGWLWADRQRLEELAVPSAFAAFLSQARTFSSD